MQTEMWNETMRETKVTYTLEMDGKFFIIENVPARVCEETGEHFFSPETVERLQQTILDKRSQRKQSKPCL
jgi:YgiT-type zinc finger domain-containing protein